MSQIKVTNAQLKTKKSQLHTLNTQLNSAIDQLESAEVRLNAMWDGDANDEFHKIFEKGKRQMRDFKRAIDQYVEALQNIIDTYDRVEDTNKSIAK